MITIWTCTTRLGAHFTVHFSLLLVVFKVRQKKLHLTAKSTQSLPTVPLSPPVSLFPAVYIKKLNLKYAGTMMDNLNTPVHDWQTSNINNFIFYLNIYTSFLDSFWATASTWLWLEPLRHTSGIQNPALDFSALLLTIKLKSNNYIAAVPTASV